jgi:C4-dicarboxylate transporter DctM subunit
VGKLIVALVIGLLFLMLISGIPIGVTLACAGTIGVWLINPDAVMGLFQSVPYRTTASYLLTTCPMFILMAELASTGITRNLFDFAAKRTRRFPASLGIATVVASAIMGAICGSSTAAAATMSKIAIPEMMRKGFPARMATAIVAVSGTLAIMIPPSVVLVLYGILTDESVGKLLMAGVIPGLLSALAYSITIVFWFKREQKKQNIPADEVLRQLVAEGQDSVTGMWKELLSVGPALILILVVLGGIYSGIVTPTEAAAVGAFATLILALIKREQNPQLVYEACVRAVKTNTMIFTIMIGARIFGYFLVFSQTTTRITQFVSNLAVDPWVILAMLVVFYIVLGCFMDGIAIILLTIPVVAPIISALGLDLIWFGILVTKLIEVGLVTPPVGINVFIASDGANIPVDEGFSGVGVLLMAEAVVVLLLMFFPGLVLWLPSLMKV